MTGAWLNPPSTPPNPVTKCVNTTASQRARESRTTSQSEPERTRVSQREPDCEPERARVSVILYRAYIAGWHKLQMFIWEADYKREAGHTSLACLNIVLLQNG